VSPVDVLAALQTVTSDAFVTAIAYYDDIEFAAKCGGDFAEEEGENYDLSAPLSKASKDLNRILDTKPKAVPDRVQLASALADAEAIVEQRDSCSGHEQQLRNELSVKEQQLRDELSGVEKACDPNIVLQKLQIDELQARSAAAHDTSLLEQQLGTDALQVSEMKEEETHARKALRDFEKARELKSRSDAYAADCDRRVQAATSQRKQQFEQQLQQLRTAARDTIAAAAQRVAVMRSITEAALVDHCSQLQQLRELISSLMALIPRA